MARRLPSLNALRAFEAAARHVSFTLAAGELNVSHAAISRHIRELEAWLGVKLFHRTGRGVELTENGAALVPDLTAGFDLLATAAGQFSAPRRRGQLVISCEVPFAALWLVPRLGGFTAEHPEVDLELDPTNRLVDFSKGEADLGIRYGSGVWRDVAATKLLDADVTPVCSPALLKKSKVRVPPDLGNVTLLQEEPKRHWQDWLEAAKVSDAVRPSGPLLKGHLAISAAESGQGFALADLILVADALLAGRLVKPFDIVVRHQAYWIVRGARSAESKAAAAFHGWLVAEMAGVVAALRAMTHSSKAGRALGD